MTCHPFNGSLLNREIVARSTLCGCRVCRHLFAADTVQEWVDETDGVGLTALCPKCGIDAVIGSASPFPEEVRFLRQLARRWGIAFPS